MRFPFFAGLYLALASGQLVAGEGFPAVEMTPVFPQVKWQRPLWMEERADGKKFVVEQAGRILIAPEIPSEKEPAVFLDISHRKPFVDNEEGLLGFAFHPRKKEVFYLSYTAHSPRRSLVVEMMTKPTNPNQADLTTERLLLELPQPYGNHNGGQISFGPDGLLYISFGDGGSANDPHGFGQNPHTWLGKILRIDVNRTSEDRPYGIPRGNMYRSGKGHPEIYATGLRNVWRMSFDRKTGELYAADVGQNKWEEINLIRRGGNYGWNYREAFHAFTNSPPDNLKFENPILEYPHTPSIENLFQHPPGLSITGGYVYRGKKIPELQGVYFYADYVQGHLFGLRQKNQKVIAHKLMVKGSPARPFASFAEDRAGELYVLCYDGKIYQITAAGEKPLQ